MPNYLCYKNKNAPYSWSHNIQWVVPVTNMELMFESHLLRLQHYSSLRSIWCARLLQVNSVIKEQDKCIVKFLRNFAWKANMLLNKTSKCRRSISWHFFHFLNNLMDIRNGSAEKLFIVAYISSFYISFF